MNKLQTTIIDLIKEIDSICRKYDITYYASGGTVIGAFRHGGFIPWDDDADLYMTRDNYKKFLQAFHKEQPFGRTFGTLEEDINYPGTITHYRNNENTSFITRYHILNACDAGVVVDIFILDPVCSNNIDLEDYIGKLKIYSDINFPFYGYVNCGNTEYMPLYLEYNKKVQRKGKFEVNRELEKELFSCPEEKATHYVLRWGTLPHIFEKDMFEKPVYVDYEGIKLPMPTKWYDYLVQLYGYNWNEIPSNIQSEGHTAIISTEHRYTNYVIDSDRFIDKIEANKMYFERKKMMIEREILRRPFIELFLKDKAQYVLMIQGEYLKDNNIDIKQLFENKKYADIISNYEIYLKAQFDPYFVGKMSHNYFYRLKNPIFIPLDDKELEILMYSLFYQSDFNKLNKLLFMRLRNGVENETFICLKLMLKKVHHIMSLYYKKEFNETLNALMHEGNEFIYSCERMTKLYFSSKLYSGIPLTDKEIQFLELKKDNDLKGDWSKIYGDYLLKIENSQFLDYYIKCVQLTNDGFILNELQRQFNLHKNYTTSIKEKNPDNYHLRLIELLDEFVDILNNHNIDYYLIDDTLISAYFNNDLGNLYKPLEIAIKPEDAYKVIDIFANNEKFVTPLNDGNIISHSFRYMSQKYFYTMILSNGEIVKKYIYIKINILRKNSVSVIKRKYTNMLNLLYRVDSMKNLNMFYRIITKIFFIFYPKKHARKVIFNNYVNMSLNNPISEYRIEKKIYHSKFFEGHSCLKIYSKEYHAPIKIEQFLLDDLKRVLFKEKIYDDSMFILYDEKNKFEDICNIFSNIKSNKRIIKDYHKAFDISVKLRSYNAKARYNWDVLLRAEDRFNLFLKYRDRKELIISMYKNKEYNQVWDELADYDRLVRIYLSKKMGLCFDKDILSIYLDLLRMRSDYKTADKLEKLVPQEHLDDIKILDI